MSDNVLRIQAYYIDLNDVVDNKVTISMVKNRQLIDTMVPTKDNPHIIFISNETNFNEVEDVEFYFHPVGDVLPTDIGPDTHGIGITYRNPYNGRLYTIFEKYNGEMCIGCGVRHDKALTREHLATIKNDLQDALTHALGMRPTPMHRTSDMHGMGNPVGFHPVTEKESENS